MSAASAARCCRSLFAAIVLIACSCASRTTAVADASVRIEPTCEDTATAQAARTFALNDSGAGLSQETARLLVHANAVPSSLTLGDRTVRVLDVVQRCEGPRLALQFLGLLLESERAPVAIGFSPPRAAEAPYARPDNACHIDLGAYCAEACPRGVFCGLCAEQERHTGGRGYLEQCRNWGQLELSRKSVPPSPEQRALGVTEVFLVDRVVVREYRADATSGAWETMVVVRELYTSEVNPKLHDAN